MLPKVDYRVRLEGFEGFREEVKVADVTNVKFNIFSSERFPAADASMDGRNGSEGVKTKLVVKKTTDKAVNNGNFVIFVGEVKCSGPSAVAITTNNHNPLGLG